MIKSKQIKPLNSSYSNLQDELESKLPTKELDSDTIGDGKVIAYKDDSGKLEYISPSSFFLDSLDSGDIEGITGKGVTADKIHEMYVALGTLSDYI